MTKKISRVSILSEEPMVYFLMTEEETLKEMNKSIREIQEVLGLSSTTIVRLLLEHFQWDKDTLTDRYWEDPDRLFRVLKLSNPSTIDSNPLSPVEQESSKKSNSTRVLTCKACYSEKPSNEFFALSCGHDHCLTCWQAYLESTISNNATGQRISCLSRCNHVVDDEKIFQLLNNNKQCKERYQRRLVNNFVESNRLTHWCPGKSCDTIVRLQSQLADDARMISCDTCESQFCFRCLRSWHDPVQCSLLEKWEKKNRDESMTSEWLVANTKPCPKCESHIEKNGGCNHMTCRKPGCAHEFCWICLAPWSEHATRQCNAYEGDKTVKDQVKARESLDRYLHYFKRYQTHHQSLEFEDKLAEQVTQRKHEISSDPMSFTEQKALDRAVRVLKECRRTLKYTYAFAFYLYRNNQAEVFECNQADLERATEALSGFLEQEISVDKNIALTLMDKTHYCDQRRRILLDHCKEGYNEHYWGGLDPY